MKDGGPAYPVDYDHHTFMPSHVDEAKRLRSGMSLRDHFAGLALQAFLSGHIAHHGHDSHWPYEAMASEAWDVADAMLATREKGSA